MDFIERELADFSGIYPQNIENWYNPQEVATGHFLPEAIPDEWIIELFDDSSPRPGRPDHLKEATLSPEANLAIKNLQEVLYRDTVGMDEMEAEVYLQEVWWSALIAAIPAVISLVQTLVKKKPKPKPTSRPPVKKKPKVNIATLKKDPQTWSALVKLLQVMSKNKTLKALREFVVSGESKPAYFGKNRIPVREGALLNAIATLAQQAKREIPDANYPDALDYLHSDEGEFAVDIGSPVERANRLVEIMHQ